MQIRTIRNLAGARGAQPLQNQSQLEPFNFRVAFTAAAAAPWITKGTAKSAWQDARGQSTSSGVTADDDTQAVTNGKWPAGQGAILTHLAIDLRLAKAAAVLSELNVHALSQLLSVYIKHQGIEYKMGRLVEWGAPYGSVTHRNSMAFAPRKLPTPFKVGPGDDIAVEVRATDDFTASTLTANAVYEVCGVFWGVRGYTGAAVQRQ